MFQCDEQWQFIRSFFERRWQHVLPVTYRSLGFLVAHRRHCCDVFLSSNVTQCAATNLHSSRYLSQGPKRPDRCQLSLVQLGATCHQATVQRSQFHTPLGATWHASVQRQEVCNGHETNLLITYLPFIWIMVVFHGRLIHYEIRIQKHASIIKMCRNSARALFCC